MKKWIGIVLGGVCAVGIGVGVYLFLQGDSPSFNKKESFLYEGKGYTADVRVDRPVIENKKVVRQNRIEKWSVSQKQKGRTLVEMSFKKKVQGYLSFSQDKTSYRQDTSTEEWMIPLDLSETRHGKLKETIKAYRVGSKKFPTVYEYEVKQKGVSRTVFIAPKFGVVKEIQKTGQNRIIYSMEMVKVSFKK